MKVIIIGSKFLSTLLFIFKIVWSDEGTDIFLVRPGCGEKFVYFPVDVNATLHCAVNSTNLVWVVDSIFLNSEAHRLIFDSRGIFQNGIRTSSDGVTASSVTIFGNIELNNNKRICCHSVVMLEIRENCTTLIIYG